MTLEEKQVIAATARKLIRLLEECDDDDFISHVLGCVESAGSCMLEVEWL